MMKHSASVVINQNNVTFTPDIYPSLFISALPSLLRLMSERTAAVSDDAAPPCPPAEMLFRNEPVLRL